MHIGDLVICITSLKPERVDLDEITFQCNKFNPTGIHLCFQRIYNIIRDVKCGRKIGVR